MTGAREQATDQFAIFRHVVYGQNDAGRFRGGDTQRFTFITGDGLFTLGGGQQLGEGRLQGRMQQLYILVEHLSVAADRPDEIEQIVVHVF